MCHGRSWTPMDLAAQRLRHALSPALWGFPAVASNERSPRPLTRVCRAECPIGHAYIMVYWWAIGDIMLC